MREFAYRVWLGLGLLLLSSHVAGAQSGTGVAVVVEIVADSANHLEARLQVPAGTNGRDLMDRIFKIEYAGFSRRFVTAIAGFKADSRQRQFWKLEIDDKTAMVGIAEVIIQKPMRLRWSLATY